MTPPAELASRATPLSQLWVELVLPENPYTGAVNDPARYSITSADDPAYSVPVPPVTVAHRHFPEDAWYADAQDAPTVATIHVTWRVFLQLPSPLVDGSSYTVAVDPTVLADPGPFAFVMGAAPSEAIHANQVAYLTDGPKVAYLSSWTGAGSIDFGAATEFSVVDEVSGEAVFTGPVTLTEAADSWSGSAIHALDFSAFATDGSYHIEVPAVGRSYPFDISAHAFDRIGTTLVRGLMQQRDGDHGLEAAVTQWARPPAHLDDAIDEHTGLQIDLVGGHMDAGDRGKYPHNSADVAGSLLSACTLFPAEIEALGESLGIPESGNGIPDFLDETLYELDYLAKTALQTSKDGAQAYYIHPANDGYEQGYPPEGASGRVWFNVTRGPYRAETLYVAGVLAMAAATPLLATYAPERLATYRQGAERAFAAFESHHADAAFWQPDEHPYDNWTAGPHPWSDEMLIAAANLYELTDDTKYRDWVLAELPADLDATRLWGWTTEGPWLNAYVSLYRSTKLDPAIREQARAAIVAWADSLLDENGWPRPFGVPLPSFAQNLVGWYFSASQVAFPMMLAYGVSGDSAYRDVLLRTWSYLLGANPLSRSYVSGLGQPDRRPRWIVHEISQYQWVEYRLGNPGWSEIIPGLYSADLQQGNYEWFLEDGGWNSSRMNERYPAIELYPALYRYHDSWTVQDEFTINQLGRGAASVVPFFIAPDPGTGGGGTGGGGGSGAGGGPAGSGGQTGSEKDEGGCGCTVPASSSQPAAPLMLVGLLLLMRRRRRAGIIASTAAQQVGHSHCTSRPFGGSPSTQAS